MCPMGILVAAATAPVATHRAAQQHLDVIQLVTKSNNTETITLKSAGIFLCTTKSCRIYQSWLGKDNPALVDFNPALWSVL